MHNPSAQPHTLSYSQLAYENDLSPEEVRHYAQYFGNDFESLQYALEDLEPTSSTLNPEDLPNGL